MADIRIKDLATTATTTASDDFMAVDGVTNGTRKLSAATPAFLTSVTTPSLTAPASIDLTLAGGSSGASLVLGQGASGVGLLTVPNTNDTRALSLKQSTNTATAHLGLFANSLYIGQNYYYSAGNVIPNVTRTSGAIVIGTGTTANSGTIDFDLGTVNTAPSVLARLTGTGNLLIGTTSETGLTGAGGLRVAATTSAGSSITGSLVVGNLTAATTVGIGGGNINAGGTGTFGGVLSTTGGSDLFQLNATSGNGVYLTLKNSGTVFGYIGDAGSLITSYSANSGTLGFRSQGAISWATAGATEKMSLSTGGAFAVTGTVRTTDTTEATTSAGIGALTTAGGIHAAKRIVSDSTEASTSSTTGAGIFAGGIYAGAASVFGSTATFAGAVTATGRITSNTSGTDGQIELAYNGGSFNGFTLKETADQTGTAFIVFKKSAGNTIGSISRVGTTDVVAYNTTSDGRLKTNVRDLTAKDSGRMIDGLKPRWFDWKNSDDNGKNIIGFIAQEEASVDSALARIGAVTVGDDDPETVTKQWAVDSGKLVPILVAELQSLRKRLTALEAK